MHRRRSMRSACYFYSRPCGRGDAYDPDVITDGCISTHAPAGGATYPGHRRLLYIYNFYSRPCGRGDKKEASDARRLCEFLLTPLREGRLKKADASGKPTIFLLTPCGRGDQILLPGARAADDISTHAPAGGATKASRRVIHPIPISTHAPAGGATKKADASGKPTIFLLTPLREGRHCCLLFLLRVFLFLLTPLREGRPRKRGGAGARLYFYSRPCGRGDVHAAPAQRNPGNFYSRPCGRGDVCR